MFDELIYDNGRTTAEQKEFIDTFGSSILVSASAGTGKTTTMIKKILKILLVEKVDITNLLVVTYTISAAGKMKHDLYDALSKALDYTNDKEMILHINKQIDMLNNADIGTIHSFCNKIIKKYFYILGIDPNYSILSNEKTKSYLLNNAITKVFDKKTKAQDEKFWQLYQNYNNSRTDVRLRDVITKLYDYLVCRIDGDEWIKEKLDTCYKCDMSNPIWQYLLDWSKNQLNDLEVDLQNCYNTADVLSCDKAKSFAVVRLDFINKIKEKNSCVDVANFITQEELPNKPTIKIDNNIELEELKTLVDKLAKQFLAKKNEIDKVFKIFISEDLKIINEINKENASEVYELYNSVKEEYSSIKKENNLLDFNDLEYYASKLCDDQKVINELKNEYKYIFVDEYQDVNPMQDNLITKIAKSNNLYMIGDVKQSIYRFRQSSPEIFLNKYFAYSSGDIDKKVILFNKNFRSDENILMAVNNIFDNAITKDCVGIDYKNEARLIAGKQKSDNETSVHLSIIDSDDIFEINQINEDKDDVTKQEYEGELIAGKVLEVIAKGKYKFKDIAILLRDKKELTRQVWITLKKYNIPVTVTIKGEIFSSNEVLVLYSLLKCVYNEADDISFVTLLKSPFIMMTDDELVDIRLNAPDVEDFYSACILAIDSPVKCRDKIVKLKNIIREFRFRILNENIGEVLKSIINEYDILTYYKSMPDGIEKECYINEFVNIVCSQSVENDLAKLLDYLDIISDKESELTISSGADSVTLMTMHSSKGLDFPVVIVGGFGEKIIKSQISDIKINKDFGFAVSGVDMSEYAQVDNVNLTAIAYKNRKEEFEEAVRLMYVAVTRPKCELYITGVVNIKNIKKLNLFKCATYFDIFLLSISNIDLNYFTNKKEKFVIDNKNSKIDCEIVNVADLQQNVKNKQVVLSLSDPKLVKELTKYYETIENRYPDISFKNSVSSILREQEADYINALENFKKMSISESLSQESAMELGTQYHTIMQYIDYRDESQNIKSLVDDLVFKGDVNSIYLDQIDINKLKKAKDVISKLIDKDSIIRKENNFLCLAPHNSLIEGSMCPYNVLLQGVIDLSIENKNGAIIVDYKTNRTKDKNYLISTYKTQLDLYAKAYEKGYNKKVITKYLYSFEMGELIEII